MFNVNEEFSTMCLTDYSLFMLHSYKKKRSMTLLLSFNNYANNASLGKFLKNHVSQKTFISIQIISIPPQYSMEG